MIPSITVRSYQTGSGRSLTGKINEVKLSDKIIKMLDGKHEHWQLQKFFDTYSFSYFYNNITGILELDDIQTGIYGIKIKI